MNNPIAFAIPVFVIAMGAELWLARRRRARLYALQDSLADLGCGVGQQVALVFFGAALLAAYEWLYQHAALVRFAPGSVWPWVLAFVAVDFAYYWWHRLSHEVSFLWAVHAVHHHSEEYNLSVALRQAVLSTVTSLPFYAPMALLGVPTLVYATMVGISTLYQFWIHTELVGKLGRAELVLNTPSHHRVHHAINPRYLDRNYGAVTIVWDRLFGSFAEERERPVYGVTKPLSSFNPVWAQVEGWVGLWRRSRALHGLDRLRVWWKSPGWTPTGMNLPTEEEVQRRPKHQRSIGKAVAVYALVQFAPLVAVTSYMMLRQESAPPALLAGLGAYVFWTLLTTGALADGARWAVPLEVLRLVAVAAAAVAYFPTPIDRPIVGAAVATTVLAFGFWLLLGTRRPASGTPG